MTGEDLQLLEARWRVREITESDLHGVADELLANGEDADALIHLFSLDRDELRWTGADAFESLLRSWGGGTISEAEAVDIVLRDIATGVLAGTITPFEGDQPRGRYKRPLLLPVRRARGVVRPPRRTGLPRSLRT